LRCSSGGGGPATGGDGARRAGAARRPSRLGDDRAHTPGNRLSNRLRPDGKRRGRRGGCPGRVREGVPRARPLPARSLVSSLAAADRRERGAQSPPFGRAARAALAARGRPGPPGGRGPVPRGGSARAREPGATAGRRRAPLRRPPRRDRVPLLPRPHRGRDRSGAPRAPRDREVAPLTRARAPARGAGERAMTPLELRLQALGHELEVPPAPDLTAGVLEQLSLSGTRPFPWRRAAVLAL